jgi:biotin-dependent carboxylase-like uncharacterized protein
MAGPLAEALRAAFAEARWGPVEVVPTWGWLTLEGHAGARSASGLLGELPELLERAGPRLGDDLAAGSAPGAAGEEAPVVLPVHFDGPDLEEVAARCGWSTDEVVAAVEAAELVVAFVGFAPGFAYLRGLPPPLAAVDRRPSPRPRVPAGSFGVAGGFCGCYPAAGPGGWQLLGRTDLALFDPRTPPYSRLQPGQRVQVVAVEQVGELPEDRRWPLVEAGQRGAGLRVLDPGPGLSLVEDGGRAGLAHLGVPRAGPVDPRAAALANRLVGNAPGEAVLECTLAGPELLAERPLLVAVLGDGPVRLDDWPVPTPGPVPVRAGQRLRIGPLRRGCRAVLAVAGGLASAELLGSRSSDLLAGLGPGPLRPGDRLPVGEPEGWPAGRLTFDSGSDPGLLAWAARVGLATPRARTDEAVPLRVLAGPDAEPSTLAALTSRLWEVDPASNRVGLRLRPQARADGPGGSAADTRAAGWTSWVPTGAARGQPRGVVLGAIQQPSSGELIVLLADHATTGGYPLPACLASVDVPLAGQLRPGCPVRLVPVGLAEAERATARAERQIARAVQGRYPRWPT